jgi:hypothetical protein
VRDIDTTASEHQFEIAVADWNMRFQRTVQRITSAVNCRPLKEWSGFTEAARRRLAMPRFAPAPGSSATSQRNLLAMPAGKNRTSPYQVGTAWAPSAMVRRAACMSSKVPKAFV